MKHNDSRERLIRAGIDLFYKKGYPNTTIREIGEKASISTSVLYHYFKDKEEVLFEIIQIAGDDLFKLLHDIIEREKDTVKCLEKMINAHMVE